MNLLFVCTGNTCRSAMAEPLLRQRLGRAGLGDQVEVRSAGVGAVAGQAASQGTKQVLNARGLDGDAHISTPLDDELIKWADLILTMSNAHKRAILERHIEAFEKTFLLKEFLDDDPKSLAIFEEMDQLQAEAQTKQALFLTEHAEEIERLQTRYQEGADEQAERELQALQSELEAAVQTETTRMLELVKQLPNYEIADPYGGPQSAYDRCAAELEALLDKLVVRLQQEL